MENSKKEQTQFYSKMTIPIIPEDSKSGIIWNKWNIIPLTK